MELELGLKLTRAADDFISDFQIGIDRAGPVFLSQETDAMFVLTGHLKGYKRGNIKIDINEDGSLIGISGEKQVKETVMVGRNVYKKDTEIKEFKKVFRIPEGVILDKIKAKFNDDESKLTVTMPKKMKGIRGTNIEEVKEKQELDRQGSGNLQIVDEMSPKTGTPIQEKDEKLKAKIGEDVKVEEDVEKVHGLKDVEEGQPISPSIQAETRKEGIENQEKVDEIQEIIEPKRDQEFDRDESLSMEKLAKEDQQETDKENGIQEERKDGPFVVESAKEASEFEGGKVEDGGEEKRRGKRYKMCIPIVAGSTLLLSLVVFVIQIIRRKNQTSSRRE